MADEARLNRVEEVVCTAILVLRHEKGGGPTQDRTAIMEAVVEERFSILDGSLVVEAHDRSRPEPGVYRVHVYSVEPTDPSPARRASQAIPSD